VESFSHVGKSEVITPIGRFRDLTGCAFKSRSSSGLAVPATEFVPAQPVNNEFLEDLADARVRNVNASRDPPQDDSLLQQVGGNSLAGAEAGRGAPLAAPVVQLLTDQLHDGSPLCSLATVLPAGTDTANDDASG
jgi:hypothetical protein